VRIQQSNHQGYVVLTLAGRLALAAAPKVQRAILKQLAEHPPAIICDLSQVEAIDPVCAEVFTSIRHPALGWPGGARPAVADILLQEGVARRLAMYPSLNQALKNARARPPRLYERLPLGPVPTAAAAGRTFVGEACDRWGLGGWPSRRCCWPVGLVTNTVVHARTALELRVQLRGPRLQVAVKDQDPNLQPIQAAKQGPTAGGA
jgi:hypothetical protein